MSCLSVCKKRWYLSVCFWNKWYCCLGFICVYVYPVFWLAMCVIISVRDTFSRGRSCIQGVSGSELTLYCSGN